MLQSRSHLPETRAHVPPRPAAPRRPSRRRRHHRPAAEDDRSSSRPRGRPGSGRTTSTGPGTPTSSTSSRREKLFATFLTPAAARRPRARAGTPGGNCALNEVLGLLRAPLLVHLAGLHPRPRADLDERQRGGQAPDRRACWTGAASSASASPRRSTAPTSTPPTWSCVPAGDGTLPGPRRQVLHRQRQRGGAALGLREDGRHRASTSSSLVDPKRPGYELVKNVVASQSYVAEFVLHDYPVGRGRHPLARPGRLGRGAQHRQRRQVQPGLGLHRHLHPRPLRGGPPRRQPPALRDGGHRLPARAAGSSPTPTRGWWP